MFLPEDTMPPSIETIRQGGADQPTGQPELIKRRCNFAHHGLRLYEHLKSVLAATDRRCHRPPKSQCAPLGWTLDR